MSKTDTPSTTASGKKESKKATNVTAPKAPANPKKSEATSEGFNVVQYFKEVKDEFGKITWPTWPQLWAQTIVVLIVVAFATTGIWGVDSLFRLIIDWVT